MKPDRKPPPKITLPPKIGLTKLRPILLLYNISRTTFFKGVDVGHYPPPRIRAAKPGESSLWDSAQIWAVVDDRDWRNVTSATERDRVRPESVVSVPARDCATAPAGESEPEPLA